MVSKYQLQFFHAVCRLSEHLSCPHLQVKWLCSRCLDLNGEACILDHDHFLFVRILSSVRLAVPILPRLCLLRGPVSPVTVYHGCICTVPCNGRDAQVISLRLVVENLTTLNKDTSRKQQPRCLCVGEKHLSSGSTTFILHCPLRSVWLFGLFSHENKDSWFI